MVKEALVVPRSLLLKEKRFEGFLPAAHHNFIPTILQHFQYYPRGDTLEHDDAVKQIITYVWMINPHTKKVFAYRRANNEAYTEKRLRNKWSCGIGGHIEREDTQNPIQNAMMRELQEEVIMQQYPSPTIIGFVNYESGVELYHFGIVALAQTSEDIAMGDGEIAEGRFMSIEEFDSLMKDPHAQVEYWTQLSWPFVKAYLEKL